MKSRRLPRWDGACSSRAMSPGSTPSTIAISHEGRTACRDAAGNRLNNAPVWSGGGSAVYEFATGPAGTASVGGDLSWQSRVFFTPANDAIETQRAYGLLHLRAGFEPRNRHWEIAVYVRNLGNQGHHRSRHNVPIPAITGRPGEPRHWGTQFTIRP